MIVLLQEIPANIITDALNSLVDVLWNTFIDLFILSIIFDFWDLAIEFVFFGGLSSSLVFLLLIAIFLFIFKLRFID